MSEKRRILTGIRPTGPLHLGHYAGARENWVKLQHEYDCSFLIANYQVSDYADDVPRVRNAVWNVAIENPEDAKTKGRSVPVAFYIYPVMQVANILMSRAHLVPVGEDQLPHLDLTRETARRFNREFKPIFPEPEALLGRAPRLVGTDGNAKMSKSRGNTIDLKDSAETVAKKVRRMYGGPPRGAKEPGKVEENPIFLYLDAFDHDAAQVQNLKERYERTGLSSKELKDRLTTVLNELLEPMRERRAKYESNLSLVREALEQGTKRGRAIARETMEMVRDALDLNYLRNTDVQSRVRFAASRC